MTYKDISDCRTKIMGAAIIWILLFHLNGRFVVHSYLPGLLSAVTAFVLGLGSTGVELFLLCSGFGLCFSMRKNPNVLRFYLNRAKRILPEYILGLALVQPMDRLRPAILILELLTVSYYLNESSHFWFISAIVLLYLVFPLIYRFLAGKDDKTFRIRAVLLVSVSTLVTFALHFIFPYYDDHLCTVFDKFTIFIIGVIIGVRYDPEKKIAGKRGIFAVLVAFEALLIAYMAYLYIYVPHEKYFLRGFIIIPLSVTIAFLLVLVLRRSGIRYSLLSLAGKTSLSLYVADGVYATFSERAASYGMPYMDNALASIPFIIILAAMIHLISRLIRKGLNRLITVK